MRVRLAQAGLLGLAATAGFLGPYLVAGVDWPAAIRHALEFQAAHAADGHDQLVAGRVMAHPPWWSNLWWQLGYLGPGGLAALWAATGAGLLLRPPGRWGARVALFTAVALVVPAAVIFASPLQLPHYHVTWSVAQALAAGLGLAALWRQAGRGWPPRLRRLAAAALATVLAVVAAGSLHRIATMRPSDYQAAATALAATGYERSRVLVWGYDAVVRAYLPRASVRNEPRVAGPAPDVIVVDPYVARREPGTAMAAYVDRVSRGYTATRFDRVTVYTRAR